MLKSQTERKIIILSGFTLAEVLITLGIIGIVAALTIPTLIKNYQDSQTRSIITKAISTLSQATLAIKGDNGGTLIGSFGATPDGYSQSPQSDGMASKYQEYLKVSQFCSYANRINCWGDIGTGNWRDKNRGVGSPNATNGAGAVLILQDGTYLMFDLNSDTCVFSSSDYIIPSCGFIFIDANGRNPPNSRGNDIFPVYITNDVLIPLSDNNVGSGIKCFSGSWPGDGCTGYLLNGQAWH